MIEILQDREKKLNLRAALILAIARDLQECIDEEDIFSMDDVFDYELIYVDDGSTDETFNILKNIREEGFNRLKVIRHQQSVGQSFSVLNGARNGKGEWLVVLDAAAYAPTHGLDLSRVKPDFVPLSFYKLFGFPTGELRCYV